MKEYRINEKQLESLKKLFEAFSLRHCEQILNELRGEGFIEYDDVGEYLDWLCNDLLEDSTEEIESYTEAKRELKYLIEDIEGQEVEDKANISDIVQAGKSIQAIANDIAQKMGMCDLPEGVKFEPKGEKIIKEVVF